MKGGRRKGRETGSDKGTARAGGSGRPQKGVRERVQFGGKSFSSRHHVEDGCGGGPCDPERAENFVTVEPVTPPAVATSGRDTREKSFYRVRKKSF